MIWGLKPSAVPNNGVIWHPHNITSSLTYQHHQLAIYIITGSLSPTSNMMAKCFYLWWRRCLVEVLVNTVQPATNRELPSCSEIIETSKNSNEINFRHMLISWLIITNPPAPAKTCHQKWKSMLEWKTFRLAKGARSPLQVSLRNSPLTITI